MTESADADAAAAARASEQARLRKERREAKIKAGGSARLNRITGLGGGFQRVNLKLTYGENISDPIPTATASGTDATTAASPAPATAAAPVSDHADPDEVDISNQHFPSPRQQQQQQQQQPPSEMSEAQLRQLMLGMDMPRGDGSAPANPFAANPFLNPGVGGGQPGGPEDPMLKMLQQMMGGQMPGGGGFPGMPGAPQQQQQQQPPPPLDTYSAAWRILHLVVALGLGLYIALTGAFTGTLEARDAARLASDAGGMSSADLDESNSRARFFYMFATAEAVLLTSRFFLDRSRAPPPGILWTVAGFLPPAMKRYLETALRYGQVFTTVRSDLLVCVFVLGVCHWWRTLGVVGL